MSENKNIVEMHGCIVCAATYNVLVVYDLHGKLVDCTVTSVGGHCLTGERRPLVACNTHTAVEIEAAYERWLTRNDPKPDEQQEAERGHSNSER